MYNIEFQLEVLKLFCTNIKFSINYGVLLSPEYFDNQQHRILFGLINDHVLGYEKEIDKKDLLIKIQDFVTSRGYSNDVFKALKTEAVLIFDAHIKSEDFVADQLVKFARKQELKSAVLKTIDILEKDGDYESALKLVEHAVSIGTGTQDGKTFKDLYDLQRLYNEKYNVDNLVRTGFHRFDAALQGGMASGEVHILCGPPKPTSKNTRIFQLNQRVSPTIEELYHRCQDDPNYKFWVYSCAPNGEIVPGQAHSVFLSCKTNKAYKITYDNGKSVECTDDHRWMMRDGTYRRADELKINDSVMPLYFKPCPEGIKDKNHYPEILHNHTGKSQPVHHMVCEDANANEYNLCWERLKEEGKKENYLVVHHKDFDKKNNSPDNLEWMGVQEHLMLHSEILVKRWKEPGNVELREEYRERLQSMWDNPSHPIHQEDVQAIMRKKVYDNPEQRKIRSESVKAAWKKDDLEESALKRKELKNSMKYKTERGLKRSQRVIDEVSSIDLKVDRENYEIVRTISTKENGRPMFYGYPSWNIYQEHLQNHSTYNHKIAKIEIIEYEEPEPMYCFKVDKYHNFAVDLGDGSGVFSHNSGKSTIACNIGAFALLTGKSVFHVSLEITDIDVLSKYACRFTGMKYGEMMSVPEAEYQEKIKKFEKYRPKLFVNHWPEGSANTLNLRAWISKERARCNIDVDLIVVDYDDPLIGGTKIPLLSGESVAIEDLVEREEFWLYACKENGEIVPGRGHTARVARQVTELIEITLDNGEKITTTVNHNHMLRDGSYKRADSFVVGDSLMPLYRDNSEGYELVKCNKTGEYKHTHRIVAENVLQLEYKNCSTRSKNLKNGSPQIHHKDFTRINNDPSNLDWLTFGEHGSVHQKRNWADPEWRQRKIESTKKQWTPEFREKRSRETKEQWKDPKFQERMAKSHENRWTDEAKKNQSSDYNHKVVKVRKIILDEPVPVYCLTVDDYHNYALEAGVFTHNCLVPVSGRTGDMYEDGGGVYTDLIQLADYFNCPVLTMAQPNRESWNMPNENMLIKAGNLAHSARKAHKCFSVSTINFKDESDNGILYMDMVRRGESKVIVNITRDLSRALIKEQSKD